jgi:hypothetical protein
MFKRNRLYELILALVALSALVLGSSAFAQTPTSTPLPTMATPAAAVRQAAIEFVGAIDAIRGTTLTILGQTVDVSRAEIETVLTVGAVVKVEGTLLSNGVIAAREIELYERDDDDRRSDVGVFELKGILTSLSPTTAVVAGISIDLTSAEIYRGVRVDGLVEIKYVSNNGSFSALELKPLTQAAFDDALSGRGGRDDRNDDDDDDRGGLDDRGNDDRGGRDDSGDDDRGGRGDSGDDDRGGRGDSGDDDRGGRGDSGDDDRGGRGDSGDDDDD